VDEDVVATRGSCTPASGGPQLDFAHAALFDHVPLFCRGSSSPGGTTDALSASRVSRLARMVTVVSLFLRGIAMNRLAAMSVCLLAGFVATVQAQDKPNPTGTWKWTTTRGDRSIEQTLKLKMEGDKLTGVLASPGRNNETRETPISEAKYKDGEISFAVTVTFNDQKRTTKYTGKVSGDAIKGKMERERDGQTQSTDWEAKRAKE
jgi:hypothetical protein